MSITIDLAPEEEQNLRWQAELVGKDISAYVQEAMRNMIVSKQPPIANDEWEKMLEEFGNTAPLDAPLLSEYAVSREGIYGDHD